MKSHQKLKTSKRSSLKGSRVIYTTSNTALNTRNASPCSNPQIASLQQKVEKLKHKLQDARSTISKYEEDRKIEKQTQKDFLRLYHMKMFDLQKSQEKCSESFDMDDKIIEERNALDAIWQRRYNEMKKIYEEKLKRLENRENLCIKCKAFVRANEDAARSIRSIKFLEKENEKLR